MEQFNREKIERELKEGDKIINWVGTSPQRGGLGHPDLARLLEIQQNALKQMLEFGVFPERIDPNLIKINTTEVMPLVLNDPFQGIKQPQECPVYYDPPKHLIQGDITKVAPTMSLSMEFSDNKTGGISVRDFFDDWTTQVQHEITNIDTLT